MKIAFLPVGCIPFHGNTLDERPLGGTETGVILLAKALRKKGCDVWVISDVSNPPLTDPLYIPFRSIRFMSGIDAVIGVRDWQSVLFDIPAKKRFLWTGDAYDQPLTVGIGDKRIANRIDGLLCVSEWQKRTLSQSSGFPLDRTYVIRNGINSDLFLDELKVTENIPHRLFYSSTPYRGLAHLLQIFPRVKQRCPEAELYIASGYDVYAGTDGIAQSQLDELAALQSEFEKISGVVWLGNLKQKDLIFQMQQAGIYAYPNTFAETSCISVMEAIASGMIPVSSNLGALSETIADCGTLVPIIKQDGETYLSNFTDAVCELISNHQLRNDFIEKGKARRGELSWDRVAERFLSVYQR